MSDHEPSFSLNDFKKWMSKQHDKPSKERNLIGLHVESKLGLRRLRTKIESTDDDYDIDEMAKDFKRRGGIITDADSSNNLTVEVDSGSFVIHKIFVKKLD